MGKVALIGLEFHGRHGVFAEETRLGARFVVDVEMEFVFANIPDRVTETVDYSAVYASVQDEVAVRRYYLIEVLANTIAERLMLEQPRLERLMVRVHKPHAPLPGVFRDVYAEVSRERVSRERVSRERVSNDTGDTTP
jgi:7,8-dihydroneopterin aldolase/epimerase/oxygenase